MRQISDNEWTYEGEAKFLKVAKTGASPVIKEVRVTARRARGFYNQFGWYRGSIAFVPLGRELFLYYFSEGSF